MNIICMVNITEYVGCKEAKLHRIGHMKEGKFHGISASKKQAEVESLVPKWQRNGKEMAILIGSA